jgi:CTP:molybdopterin cytidylyltransferase MocA
MGCAGVVLAAGASRRMGRPKAMLTIGGQTFLDNLTEVLARGGCQPVLAVVSEPLQDIRAGCRLAGVDLVINPDPARGQLSSLLCARDALQDVSGMLVVLVDQADLRVATVEAVRLSLEQAPAAVARFGGQPGHPTGFSRQLFAALGEPGVSAVGARAVIDAQAALGQVAWVDVPDPGVVRNLNTPAELTRFLEELERPAP